MKTISYQMKSFDGFISSVDTIDTILNSEYHTITKTTNEAKIKMAFLFCEETISNL